jgi:diacylglycerol diphosphate phosphatase/phosphatidate phosphatase
MRLLQDPVQKRLLISYLYDWLLVIIMTAAFFAIDKITPFHRLFSIEDKTIMFPYAEKEAVPVWLLLVSSAIEKFSYLLSLSNKNRLFAL